MGIDLHHARHCHPVIDDLAVGSSEMRQIFRLSAFPRSVRSAASPGSTPRHKTFPVELFGELIPGTALVFR